MLLPNSASQTPSHHAAAIRSLAEALDAAAAAHAADVSLELSGAAGIDRALGVGWFAALREIVQEKYPALAIGIAFDSGDDAGTAQGALRRGIDRVIFRGNDTARSRLEAIAAQTGATILSPPQPLSPVQGGLTESAGAL